MKPRFITFTGFDRFVDIRKAVEIALRYPVEYGFLFSPDKIHVMYYKNISEAGQFLLKNRLNIKISAHLCGGYADMINAGLNVLDVVPELKYFNRWQINARTYNLDNCIRYAETGIEIILQNRLNHFPVLPHPNLYWLYDKSGGRGIVPTAWPPQGDINQFVGYAGGMTPSNIEAVYADIKANAYSYWLDMESGVRTNGLFDLSKVEEICSKVYPDVR